MPKFYRKTGRVEAEQFNPEDTGQHDRLGIEYRPGARIGICSRATGKAVVNPGDWIVTEGGQVTICPDGEFREKYQFVAGG